MTRWMQSATFVCFVVTEALAWFIVLRVIATALDASVMNELLIDLERGLGGPLTDAQVAGATAALRDAKDSLTSGPSLLLMIVAAFAAVYLSRVVTELRIGRGLAAVTGIFGSIVLLNVLLHIALAGDLVVWDNSALTNFLDDPSSRLSGLPQARAFVDNPVPGDLRGSSLVVITGGMFLMWGRFLFVGRGDVSFDRALRSFTIGFPLVMIAVVGGLATSASAGIYALPYFVLAMLTLAVANAARTVEVDRGLSSSAPWITSALATLGVLTVVANLFGLIALLEVEQVITPLGEVVGRVVGWILLIIVTPVFWLAQTIMDFFNINPGVFEETEAAASLLEDIAEELEEEEDPARWPDWLIDGFRLAVFFTISYALYWIGRVLFAKRKDEDDGGDDANEEEHGVVEGGGIGGLLRGIFPGRRVERVPPWLSRHAIYQLYARIVGAAEERGFRRRLGETPLEFARAATTPLDAELFNEIASEFDRARYGRHFREDEDVRRLGRALSEWESAHPATLKLRQTVARDLSEDEPPSSPLDPPEQSPDMPQPGMV